MDFTQTFVQVSLILVFLCTKVFFANTMKVHCKQLFYSILFLLIATRIQADEFLYKQMSISEGFPPYIQHIYTEENGFVWISSKQGLGKFNGYELKSYFHDDKNPYSLPGNES